MTKKTALKLTEEKLFVISFQTHVRTREIQYKILYVIYFYTLNGVIFRFKLFK